MKGKGGKEGARSKEAMRVLEGKALQSQQQGQRDARSVCSEGKKVRNSVWLDSVKGTENRSEAVRDRERPR